MANQRAELIKAAESTSRKKHEAIMRGDRREAQRLDAIERQAYAALNKIDGIPEDPGVTSGSKNYTGLVPERED